MPETPMRSRRHGISRTRPDLMSSSTSRKTSSSLPLAISRFICSSHSSSFQPCNHAANSAPLFERKLFDGSLDFRKAHVADLTIAQLLFQVPVIQSERLSIGSSRVALI